jgi:hypothetical protein
MLVQERTVRGEDIVQLPLVTDFPHASLSAAASDGGARPISRFVSIISFEVFQGADCGQPHARFSSLSQMSDR